MVFFWPIQQELDCINDSGTILGKIKFNSKTDAYLFEPDNDSVALSEEEKFSIDNKLSKLNSGETILPMQDDD